MAEKKIKRRKKETPAENLFRNFRFRGRLKDSPTGLEHTEYSPKVAATIELDHVRSDDTVFE